MSTVLQFRASARSGRGKPAEAPDCEIVIFPGVRIERHDVATLDLGHRVTDTTGGDGFDGVGGRPRKTS
jgi:hypothetical protein